MNVYISRRREYEFGIAFGYWSDWVDDYKSWSIRFSFAKYALVIALRAKPKGKK